MATEVQRFVDTDVVGGTGDGSSWANAFASLDAWLAAETSRDLVALDRKLTVNYRSTPATARQGILDFGAGWVTDAARFIEIFVPPASRYQGARGTGTYLRIIDNGFEFPLTNQPSAILYNGLALWVTGTSRTAFGFSSSTHRATNCACFLQSSGTSASAFQLNNGTAVNCIGVVDGLGRAFNRTSGTGTAINCVGRTTTADAFAGAGMVLTSCYGFSDAGNGFEPFGTKINCFSPDGNNGATALPLANAAFVSTALGSEDLRLTAPSLLINAGQDNSGNPLWIGSAEDFLGTARPQGAAWDVGAHEWFDPGIVSGTIHAASHVEGDVATPNNAIGPPDGVWTTDLNVNASWASRWRLTAIPDAEPVGTQQITLRARKGSNSGDPSVSEVTLWEGGAQVAVISGGSTTVTSTTGVDLQYTFDGAVLAGLVDVDIRVATSGTGGSPSARNAVQIDAITADVQYVMPAPGVGADAGITSPAAAVAGETAAAASASAGIRATPGGFAAAASMAADASAGVSAPSASVGVASAATSGAAASVTATSPRIEVVSGAISSVAADVGFAAPVGVVGASVAAGAGAAVSAASRAAQAAAQVAAQAGAVAGIDGTIPAVDGGAEAAAGADATIAARVPGVSAGADASADASAAVGAPVPRLSVISGAIAGVAADVAFAAPAGRVGVVSGASSGGGVAVISGAASISVGATARAGVQAAATAPAGDFAATTAALAAAAANLLAPPGEIAALAGVEGVGGITIDFTTEAVWRDGTLTHGTWRRPPAAQAAWRTYRTWAVWRSGT